MVEKWVIWWMEEILHHLGWNKLKPHKKLIKMG
jgi:hypothetical protein